MRIADDLIHGNSDTDEKVSKIESIILKCANSCFESVKNRPRRSWMSGKWFKLRCVPRFKYGAAANVAVSTTTFRA